MQPQAWIPCVVLCLGSAGAVTRYFPQIGDGEAAGIRFTTSLVFVNTGTATSLAVGFRDESGAPLEFDLGQQLGAGSDFVITLQSGQALQMETPGKGSLRTGYAFFDAEAAVGATAVFAGSDVTRGIRLFEAGVPATAPIDKFTVFVDSRGSGNTGIAFLRPGADAVSETGEGSVGLRLLSDTAQQIAETELTLAAGHKVALFINELFPEPVREQAEEMVGTLQVSSPNTPIAAVTLRQVIPAQAFPGGVPVLSAFPVVGGIGEWKLVWSDEFEGSAVDPSKWDFQLGNSSPEIGGGAAGWGNNELEYYTSRPANARVEGGYLTITARKEEYAGYHYTSARMRTIHKGDWTYGRFEIRAKLPKGKGLWPALWMMPTDSQYGTWAASGEIDIVEELGHEPNKVYGTLHYGGVWPQNKSSGGNFILNSGDFSQDFHIFAMEWEHGVFRWYVDGELYQAQTQWYSTSAPYPAPFDRSFHLIFNLAVGGNWPGAPDQSTQFPQELVVDYVRVYQKN